MSLGNPAVLAHGGHGNEFLREGKTTQAVGSIQVDAQTAKRLGIKVEPVNRTRLLVGIKTTGQIETLPSKKVEVTRRVVEVKIRLNRKDSKRVPHFTNLQVQTAISL